jgi:hypothetical protein
MLLTSVTSDRFGILDLCAATHKERCEEVRAKICAISNYSWRNDALVFGGVSKTFYVKVDAAEASTGRQRSL